MLFDETYRAYQTKKQSMARKMVASLSPHFVSIVYNYSNDF
jgi:hypothetical protein